MTGSGNDEMKTTLRAGHGSQKDATGKERDGLSQTICPWDDVDIPDTLIHQKLVRPLPLVSTALLSAGSTCWAGCHAA